MEYDEITQVSFRCLRLLHASVNVLQVPLTALCLPPWRDHPQALTKEVHLLTAVGRVLNQHVRYNSWVRPFCSP